MTLASPATAQAPDPQVRRQVDTVLTEFLRAKEADACARGMPDDMVRTVADFLHSGGKRLRPALCVLGQHAAAGSGPVPRAVVQVAAALEMFHAFALIHDDIMDGSDLRRSRPTVHRALARGYAGNRPPALAERLGNGVGVLVGDLALCWSDELVHTAGLPARRLARLLPVLADMRTEVMYGQYLDLTATGRPSADVEGALAIVRCKTARYTVERPLHIGAVLAGGSQELLDALTSYALPLGEAFQLRDDLLGVFGDPADTGKPRLDDLRAGKHTVLVALALRDAPPPQRRRLSGLLGRPDLGEAEAEQVRALLTRVGARQKVEEMIARRRDDVLRQLARPGPIHPDAVAALHGIAVSATERIA